LFPSDTLPEQLSLGKETVAWFERSRHEDGESELRKPYITILPVAEQIMDQVVVSILIMEQKERWSKGNPIPADARSYMVAGSAFAGALG